MKRWYGFLLPLTLAALCCNSEIDRQLKEIDSLYPYIEPSIVLDSLPRSTDSLLMAFGKQHPKHKRSENFVHRAIDIKLKKGMHLQAAKWAVYYLETFKSNPTHRLENAVMGAHHFEQHQVFDQALKLYKVIVNEFPEEDIAEQAEQIIYFIEKGLITPEQQLNYLLEQKKNK